MPDFPLALADGPLESSADVFWFHRDDALQCSAVRGVVYDDAGPRLVDEDSRTHDPAECWVSPDACRAALRAELGRREANHALFARRAREALARLEGGGA